MKTILNLVILNLMQIILTIVTILLLTSCAPPFEEAYPPKWVIASTYLPKMEGYRNAGFFEIGNSIYSHYCDDKGNMIRLKYNEDGHIWKQVKYETHGCI